MFNLQCESAWSFMKHITSLIILILIWSSGGWAEILRVMVLSAGTTMICLDTAVDKWKRPFGDEVR